MQMFFEWANSASFLFIFGLFKQTVQFLQQINVKKCQYSIQHWDLNPQPFEHDLSPIITRPGLPPKNLELKLPNVGNHRSLNTI